METFIKRDNRFGGLLVESFYFISILHLMLKWALELDMGLNPS